MNWQNVLSRMLLSGRVRSMSEIHNKNKCSTKSMNEISVFSFFAVRSSRAAVAVSSSENEIEDEKSFSELKLCCLHTESF